MKTQVDQQEKERLKPLLMKFVKECVSPQAWDDITGVDISTIGRIDREVKEDDKNKVCFVVYSKKRLPKSCRRVKEYEGVKICWVVKTLKE